MKSTHAQVAKIIRTELKKMGVKAQVTSSSYSMGTSVDVEVHDVSFVVYQKIEKFCAQFEYGHFDGRTDCYEYSNRNDSIPQVKFVMVSRKYSEEIREKVNTYIDATGAERESAWDILTGARGDFWPAMGIQ